MLYYQSSGVSENEDFLMNGYAVIHSNGWVIVYRSTGKETKIKSALHGYGGKMLWEDMNDEKAGDWIRKNPLKD